MVKNAMFGARELSFIFCLAESRRFGTVRNLILYFVLVLHTVIYCLTHLNLVSLGSESEQGIFEQVLKGDLDFVSEPWPSISEGAKDLVSRMLVRDPKKRLTAHEVLCKFTFFLYAQVFILVSVQMLLYDL